MPSSQDLQDQAFISVRLVVVDHYMAPPIDDLDPMYSTFRSAIVRKVPVIRIFGPTLNGQKCCLHLHGIFPYIYVPMPPNAKENFKYQLASSLDKAINISLGASESRAEHVYKIVEVSGRPFYGYHPREHKFLKIFFFNPLIVKRAADMLQHGAVMDRVLQPHSSHVPFTLQFMMDYNLQGMNSIHLSHVKFRRTLTPDRPDSFPSTPSSQSWLDLSSLPSPSQRRFDVDRMPEVLLLPYEVKRMASTELEVDGVAADILNSNDLSRGGMNPGLKSIWDDERIRRQILDIDEPLELPSSPPRGELPLTNSEKFWSDRFKEKIAKLKEDPEFFVSASSGSDPDATVNMRVYPAETPEGSSLPDATQLEAHVPTLSDSILEASSASRKRSTEEDMFSEDTSAYFDETIIDEELVSQSLSTPAKTQSVLDEDDLELVDLLRDLGKEKGEEAKADEAPEDYEKESLEMSQVCWDSDPFVMSSNESEGKGEKEKPKKNEESLSQAILWGEDSNDESFWNDLKLDEM